MLPGSSGGLILVIWILWLILALIFGATLFKCHKPVTPTTKIPTVVTILEPGLRCGEFK